MKEINCSCAIPDSSVKVNFDIRIKENKEQLSYINQLVFNNTNENSWVYGAYIADIDSFFIVYKDRDTNKTIATLGFIEEDTIVFSKPVIVTNAKIDYISAVYVPTVNRVVIAYQDCSDSNYGKIISVSFKDKSIVLSSDKVFNASKTRFISTAYDYKSDKIIIAFRDEDKEGKGKLVVANFIKDYELVVTDPIIFNEGYTSHITTSYISKENKTLLAYGSFIRAQTSKDKDISYSAVMLLGFDGYKLLMLPEFKFYNGYIDFLSSLYDVDKNKAYITFRDYSDTGNNGFIECSFTDKDILFSDKVVVDESKRKEYSFLPFYSPYDKEAKVFYSDKSKVISGTISLERI